MGNSSGLGSIWNRKPLDSGLQLHCCLPAVEAVSNFLPALKLTAHFPHHQNECRILTRQTKRLRYFLSGLWNYLLDVCMAESWAFAANNNRFRFFFFSGKNGGLILECQLFYLIGSNEFNITKSISVGWTLTSLVSHWFYKWGRTPACKKAFLYWIVLGH